MQKVDPLTSQECPYDNGCAVLDHMTKSKEPNVSILVDAFLGIPWGQRRELSSLMFISDLSLKKISRSQGAVVRACNPSS